MSNFKKIIMPLVLVSIIGIPCVVYGKANITKEKENIINEADKIVPGIREQWEKTINERKELKDQLKEIRVEENIEKGEMEEEEAKKFREEQREKFRKSHGDETDISKEMIMQHKKDWQDFEEAVKKKDSNDIKVKYEKVIENMNERNDNLREKIKNKS